MHEDAKEQLSAFADGELEAGPRRFLLRRLEHDAELRGSWDRYHLASACLKQARPALVGAGLAQRIAEAITAEAVPARAGRGLRLVAGGAVAAAVALVALVAVRPQAPDPGLPEIARVAPATTPVIVGQVASTGISEQDLRPDFARVPAQTVAATRGAALPAAPRTRPGIESYLVRHNQALHAQGRASFVPYVYLVRQPSEPEPVAAGAERPR
ncbi:MAG TPA: sigma-E factor negative regulatory protein [Xanthomonadaceae bacterium]|nr:sigma-E factor negative regulatory protein [Xanthomonadaceae bacterium]